MKAAPRWQTSSPATALRDRAAAAGAGIVPLLKRLRSSQPFNSFATSAIRAILRASRARSETVIKHLHRLGEVTDELPNGRMLRLWSQADDWISNQVFWRGWHGYEPETTALFFRLAAQTRATLDVGAYVGFFTLLAAHANPSGRVYAFEPLGDVFSRLEQNVRRNGLTNVRCIHGAVAAEAGTAEFFTTNAPLPSSSSLSFEFMRDAPGLRAIPVHVLTIDRFLDDVGERAVDLVKIDTETTEPDVLRGMTGLLRANRPFIVCEVLRGRARVAELDSILRPLGYRYYLLTPEGPRLQPAIEPHPEWLNFLFIPIPPAEVAAI